MSTRLHWTRLMGNCELTLLEVARWGGAPPLPDPPTPLPPVQVGRCELVVMTRCPDDGDVDLEVWAGDTGPLPAGWEVVFDGELETERWGFDAGTATASTFHVDVPPGSYRVRAEARRDERGLVDAVRFVFPENDDLTGYGMDD